MMDVLTSIRPRAEHLDEATSNALLDHVVGSPRRARRRWGLWLSGASIGVVLAAGGAAAAGLVPDVVSDRFQQIRGDSGGWPDPVTGERLVVDVPLSNGQVARVWHADTVGGGCEIRSMSARVTRPEDMGVGCGRWNTPDDQLWFDLSGDVWQERPSGPAVAYGDLGWPAMPPAARTVTRVRVEGPGWTRLAEVDSRRHTWGLEVPAVAPGDVLRLVYLDAAGRVVATSTVEGTVESE
jgi:hypothetical protein